MRYVPLLLLLSCGVGETASRSDPLGTGLPCKVDGDCPPGLVCLSLVCSLPPDAGISAPPADAGTGPKHHDDDDDDDNDDDDDDGH